MQFNSQINKEKSNLLNQQIKVNLKEAPDFKCEECDNDTFEIAYKIKKLSALISPTGQNTYVPMQMFSCKKCSHINSEFLKLQEEEE